MKIEFMLELGEITLRRNVTEEVSCVLRKIADSWYSRTVRRGMFVEKESGIVDGINYYITITPE